MRSEFVFSVYFYLVCLFGAFIFWWGRVFNFLFVIKILEENVIIFNYCSNDIYDLTDNNEGLDM